MGDVNNQNTAGEAGSNAIDMEALAIKMAEIMAKQAPKTQENSVERLAKNVVNSFDGLTDELKTQLYNGYLADEAKKKTAEAEKYSKALKELEKANAQIKAYEAEKLQASIKQNSISVLNALNITEANNISLIQDLAGNKLYECVKEDGSFDDVKAKTLFEDITKKYGLTFEKKETKQENPYFRLGGKPQGEVVSSKPKSMHQALSENLKI
jgi:hypothetical protein